MKSVFLVSSSLFFSQIIFAAPVEEKNTEESIRSSIAPTAERLVQQPSIHDTVSSIVEQMILRRNFQDICDKGTGRCK